MALLWIGDTVVIYIADMRPIKHHYIPEFYLKRWVNRPGPTLCEFSKPFDTVKPRRVSPGGTGYVDRLYAMKGLPEELAQQVEERFFSFVDNGAADALARLEADGNQARLSVDQRSAWSRFLVSLLSRTPEDVEAFRVVWGMAMSDFSPKAEARYAASRDDADPPTWAEYEVARPVAEREKELFEALIKIMDNPNIGGRLNAQPFRVVEFPPDAIELMTSDRPIIRNHSGLAAPDGHLAIPIGPRRMFITAPNADYLDRLERASGPALAKEVNKQVVQHAAKYAYGRTDDNLVFVRKHLSALTEPRLINPSMLERIKRRNADATKQDRPTNWHALLASNRATK